MYAPSYGDTKEQVIRYTRNILLFCNILKIKTIAGPATSGVVIAMACFMLSDKPLDVLFLGKKGYRRRNHSAGPQAMTAIDNYSSRFPFGRILIVDDCTETGKSFIDSIKEIRRYNLQQSTIVGCVTSSFSSKSAYRIHSIYPDVRLFSLKHMSEVITYKGYDSIDLIDI